MTYLSAFDHRRRRRRRRRLVVLLLVAIVGTVIALAARSRTERRETTAYLALAQEIADHQLDISTNLSNLMSSIDNLERQHIFLRLDTLAADGKASVLRLEQAVVSRLAAKASGLLLVAVANWAAAVEAIGPAFIAILDGPEDDSAGDHLLFEAFLVLRVADAAYLQFLQAIGEIDDEIASGAFPDVAFSGSENAAIFDAELVVSRLRLARTLKEKHDVVVTATMDPELIADPNGFQVLQVAESYAVVVVVTNAGNVGEELVEVSLAMANSSQSLDLIEFTELIPFLEPGQATAVEFNDLILEPGVFYELLVSVLLVGDTAPEDNLFNLTFFTNESE